MKPIFTGCLILILTLPLVGCLGRVPPAAEHLVGTTPAPLTSNDWNARGQWVLSHLGFTLSGELIVRKRDQALKVAALTDTGLVVAAFTVEADGSIESAPGRALPAGFTALARLLAGGWLPHSTASGAWNGRAYRHHDALGTFSWGGDPLRPILVRFPDAWARYDWAAEKLPRAGRWQGELGGKAEVRLHLVGNG